jgi:hypothetical protein
LTACTTEESNAEVPLLSLSIVEEFEGQGRFRNVDSYKATRLHAVY